MWQSQQATDWRKTVKCKLFLKVFFTQRNIHEWIFWRLCFKVSALWKKRKVRGTGFLEVVEVTSCFLSFLCSQIFIHMLPPYLGMLRPKVETPLSLETIPRRQQKVVSISKVCDEYFIRKPDSSILFPKPNRWDQTNAWSGVILQIYVLVLMHVIVLGNTNGQHVCAYFKTEAKFDLDLFSDRIRELKLLVFMRSIFYLNIFHLWTKSGQLKWQIL